VIVVTSPVRASPLRGAVAELLEDCGLPAADLEDAGMRHFFYAGSEKKPAGIVGVELCGENALLRSLAVRDGERGSGLGSRLVAHAENYAHSQGARAMYLLTTTAARFFAQRGYAAASREAAPEEIRKTTEFAEICPASSVCMTKRLDALT
jgi:amino-acid N-acetyltransferase